MELTNVDKQIITCLQGDLPLVREPYAVIAKEIGISTGELLDRINSYLNSGIMRRFGTILRHHQAGYNANAMCCWQVPAEQVEAVGVIMAKHPAASHVYLRPTYPDWPYNLFTMLHGRSGDDLVQAAQEIAEQTGIACYKLLYSTREFKKTSMEYFK